MNAGMGNIGQIDSNSSSMAANYAKDRKTPPPSSSTTMKTKWLKAFSKLKSSPPQPSTPLREEIK